MIINKKLNLGLILIFFIAFTNLQAWAQEKTNTITEQVSKTLDLQKGSPLYLYNGKIVSKKVVEKISKESIDSISIIKPKNAFKKYRGKGKNGVVEVYGKKILGLIENKLVSNISMTSAKDFLIEKALKNDIPDFNKALIIVDDKKKTKAILDSITMPNVASIKFKTGKEFEIQQKYGRAAKNGVILIKTINRDAIRKKYYDFLLNNEEKLFVIDGRPSTFKVAKNLNPFQIKTVNLLKDEAATGIYGSRGKKGVVLIYLKKN